MFKNTEFYKQQQDRSNGNRIFTGDEPLIPDEIIPPDKYSFDDHHLDFHISHQMRKTSGKQAGLMVQVQRQAELDEFRARRAMQMKIQLDSDAIQYMNRICHFRDQCAISVHPQVLDRVNSMTERTLEIIEHLPLASTGNFLRRYSLG